MNSLDHGSRHQPRCSYCGASMATIDPQWMPFCSRRCKETDLLNWLTESYGLPYEGDEKPEEENVYGIEDDE